MASAKAESVPISRATFPAWLRILLLLVATTLGYWNSLTTPFLFDDTVAILNNPTIRHLNSFAVLTPPGDGSTTTGRPLVNLSFAINYAISGEHVWSYHLGNLLIHALAALALMGMIEGALLKHRTGISASWLGFLVALLWALHPLQTESVGCVAQRTESLCGLFYLATFYFFARAVSKHDHVRSRWLTCAVICCLAGMATKELMVTAPVLLLLYDGTFFAGSFATAWQQRRPFYLGLASTWFLTALLVWQGHGERGAAAGFNLGLSPWHYLLQQCEAIVLYLKLSLWPHPLVLDYGTAVAHSIGEVWWQGLIVISLLGITLWALWRHPVWGFIGAWFFVILAPSSSIVPLVTQTMAEHRMYLPLASVIALVVIGASRFLGRRIIWFGAATALACGAATISRNHDYRDTVAIWSDSVEKYPLNPRAHNNLAWALTAKGAVDEANGHFARAVELQPDYASAHYNWGVALLDQKKPAAAIAQFEAVVKSAPRHADAYLNLGNALMQVQRAAEAVPRYEMALRLHPAADAHYDLGVALIELQRLTEATTQLRAALASDPTIADASYQLGRIAEMTGQLPEAEVQFGSALKSNPDHLNAHRKLALLQARLEQFTAAEEHFRAVVRLQPGDPESLTNLGNILLVQQKTRDAISAYEDALRIRPDDARTLANLKIARESLH